MREYHYGFSTGALALGDFNHALALLDGQGASAIELSALRDTELPGLMSQAASLQLSQYEYVSVHAPSRFETISEEQCADLLLPCIERGWPVVLHPDAIQSPEAWSPFGAWLCIENMDKRKTAGRTAEELKEWFDVFPGATFCLDLGHARQVDPSLAVARQLIRSFGSRMMQIHLSELDVRGQHEPLSYDAVSALQELAHLLRPVAVILESRVEVAEIQEELRMAKLTLEPIASHSDAASSL